MRRSEESGLGCAIEALALVAVILVSSWCSRKGGLAQETYIPSLVTGAYGVAPVFRPPVAGSRIAYRGTAMVQELFEPHDMAKLMEEAGSSCRTPGAVNARVRTGYMVPDYRTKRGINCWTVDGAVREVRAERWRMQLARNLGLSRQDTARLLQRWWPKEPVQLVLAS